MTDRPLVLIADDDRATRSFLRIALEREGFDTVLAANGQEALDLIRERPVEVVLLDRRERRSCRSPYSASRSFL